MDGYLLQVLRIITRLNVIYYTVSSRRRTVKWACPTRWNCLLTTRRKRSNFTVHYKQPPPPSPPPPPLWISKKTTPERKRHSFRFFVTESVCKSAVQSRRPHRRRHRKTTAGIILENEINPLQVVWNKHRVILKKNIKTCT